MPSLLQEIQDLAEWPIKPEDIGSPVKKSKSKTKAETSIKTPTKKLKVTTKTSLDFRFAHSESTSLLLRLTPSKNLLSPKSTKAFQQELKKIDTYTPPKEIKKTSKRGTPEIIESQHGKVLYLQDNNGLFFNYSNKKPKCKRKLVDESDYVKTKKISAVITEKLLRKVALRILKNGGRRCKSQRAVMGLSAAEFVKKFSLDNREEWGHLVAHRFLGDLSQHQKNLTAITQHANSEMIGVEDFVATIAMQNIGKIKIVVSAHFKENEKEASFINYDVHINGLVIPFVFEAQQQNQPDIANQKAMQTFSAILLSHKKLEDNKNKKPLALSSKFPMLFSKSVTAAKAKLDEEMKSSKAVCKKAKFK